MEYTNLARTGLSVSRLVLGTMNFGMDARRKDNCAPIARWLASMRRRTTMRRGLAWAATMMCLALLPSCERKPAEATPKLSTLDGRVSYMLGLNLSQLLRRSPVQVDVAWLRKGLDDGLSKAKSQLSEAEMDGMIDAFRKMLAAKARPGADEPAEEGGTTTGSPPAEAPTEPASGATALTTREQKIAYSLGVRFGKDLEELPFEVDLDLVMLSVTRALDGAEPLLTEEERKEVIETFREKLAAQREQRRKELAEKNSKEGETFLAENKKKDGIVTRPSGLQYRVLKPGNGPSPSKADTVAVQYEGRLIDGTVFDSSYRRGQTASFPVGNVIAGWTEALQLMKPGAKWRLFIPSKLAYGARGARPAIGPNATLIFDVELLSVKPPPELPPSAAPPQETTGKENQ